MVSETKRLSGNQQALLLAMRHMALLIDEEGSVVYMNQSAERFFGALHSESPGQCDTAAQVRSRLKDFLSVAKASKKKTAAGQGTINGYYLDYSVAPFHGYRGDKLYWLILQNLTEEKKYQEQLAQVQGNIDSILMHKIGQLKETERIRKSLARQLESFKHHLTHHPAHGLMVGSSSLMHELRELIIQVAHTDSTVLVTGESGTGKELVVNMIHETSRRKDKPLLKINCNAINDELLESDLFGHEKGAFTGAHAKKKGKFEVVDGGTLFLDEIGDISPRMQAILLRVLQDGELIRVGGTKPIKVNVRIIAATNIDLAAAVQHGRFRLDLFYRLSILNITLPPLRERREDIPELADHFIAKYGTAFAKNIELIDKSVMDTLCRHDWPGNVRELANVMQRAVLMSRDNMLTARDIMFDNAAICAATACTMSSLVEKYNGATLKEIVSEFEKEVLTHKLRKYQGNVSQVADVLHVGKTALYEKLKRHRLSAKHLHWPLPN